MTEEQHIALVDVGNHFWQELGKLTAKCLKMLPKDMDIDEAVAYFSDISSVYGTEYEEYLEAMSLNEGT